MSTPTTRHPLPQTRLDLPELLDQQQVDSFIKDGYLVLPDLVSPDDLETLKSDTLDLARGKYPADSLKPLPPETTDKEALRRILCIHQPHYVSPTIERFIRHEKICAALSQITAAHLPFWDGSVKCMQSMLFVKPPTFQGQAWHQDEIYIPTRDRSLCGAWIAIDDATIDNGCLWVIPGSHRTGILYDQRPHNQPEEFDASAESYGFDDSTEVPVEVKAGTVVFFNGHLLHRSRKNNSDIYRRVLVSHYMNAWSKLPWHVQDGETVANADRRTVLPVAGIDPYNWKPLEQPLHEVGLRSCKANTDDETMQEEIDKPVAAER